MVEEISSSSFFEKKKQIYVDQTQQALDKSINGDHGNVYYCPDFVL